MLCAAERLRKAEGSVLRVAARALDRTRMGVAKLAAHSPWRGWLAGRR